MLTSRKGRAPVAMMVESSEVMEGEAPQQDAGTVSHLFSFLLIIFSKDLAKRYISSTVSSANEIASASPLHEGVLSRRNLVNSVDLPGTGACRACRHCSQNLCLIPENSHRTSLEDLEKIPYISIHHLQVDFRAPRSNFASRLQGISRRSPQILRIETK